MSKNNWEQTLDELKQEIASIKGRAGTFSMKFEEMRRQAESFKIAFLNHRLEAQRRSLARTRGYTSIMRDGKRLGASLGAAAAGLIFGGIITRDKFAALHTGISAFDGFGKALRNKYPDKLTARPKNLFQNVAALSDCLINTCGESLSDLIGKSEYEFLTKWFQVRHIYEHNMGVADDDFVRKVPGSNHLKGKKFPINRSEIEKFLNELDKTGNVLMKFLEKA